MHLKRIELSGFKTFPDHTQIVFSPGITAVVGPNGCGKSNLMDAVRWVLGEQRVRILRGGRMEEVIFGGTPQRPALSAAEVTLAIDNQAGRLPTEYAEVAVTRRLDRSGDSEYRLNQVVCRLRDIEDLFLDTGMGSHGYAVIQAAMIDAILSDNPEERRFLFEEAAGVSKYKHRQQAALRKMQGTEQDLLRITDLKNEVATRVRSLAYQKGMADRHRQLRERWRNAEIALAAREYRRRLAQTGELQTQFDSARDAAALIVARCDALESEWQSLRLAADEAERVAQSLSDRLAEAGSTLQAHKAELMRVQDQMRHLKDERERASERIAALDSRAAELRGRIAKAEADLAQARREHQTVIDRCGELESRYRAAADRLTELTGQLRNADQALDSARQVHLRVTTQRESLAAIQHDAQRQREALQSRRDHQTDLIGQLSSAIEQLDQESIAIRSRREAAWAELADRRSRTTALQTEQTRLAEELRHREARLVELRSAREMIAALIARGEGLGRGAAHILSDPSRWQGRVTGWVDRLRPHAGWERAVEAALADRVGALICSDADAAREITQILMNGSVGRAIVLDPSLRDERHDPRPSVDDPRFAGWLSERIDCADDDRVWVDAIMGSVATVETMDEARQLYANLRGEYTVASRDGVVIAPPGIVSAGTESDEPIVGRESRLRELDGKITESQDSLLTGADHLRKIADDMDVEHQLTCESESLVKGLDDQLTTLQLKLQEERTRMQEAQRRSDELDAEMAALIPTAGMVGAGDGDSEESLRRQVEQCSLARDQAAAQSEEAEQRLHQTSAALNQSRIEMVEAQAQVEALAVEIERHCAVTTELAQERSELVERVARIGQEMESLQSKILDLSKREQALAEQLRLLEEQRSQARAESSRRKDHVLEVEQHLRELRRERELAEQARTRLELDLAALRHDAEQWRGRTLDTHQIDLATARIADTQESDDELRQKATSLAQSLERMGPVNPLALEEYDHEKERFDFLEKQVKDLQQAKQSLADTIVELNRTAGQRFVETFGAARAHFQSVFSELFQGGEADVMLIDADHPLESPIEIIARPRGKKFIGIRQLSGGERALTALALLFGLYLVKPSPFCILDEVDAPLDDANCGRFLRLIDRLKARTQFIIVTHNKLTMEAADILYGVTMEQPGVSKVISVRLNRAGEIEGEAGLAEPRFALENAATVTPQTA